MDMVSYLPQVIHYLNLVKLDGVPGWKGNRDFVVEPLAQGEYNMNYLLAQAEDCWVLRVNLGTQINREDQIAYEFKALRLLEKSGVTPRPFFLDDSKTLIDHGLLIMEYLPGEPLNYQTDLYQAANLFACLHSMEIPAEHNHLIREDHPLSGMYAECSGLAQVYLQSSLADAEVSHYLNDVLAWAQEARKKESYFLEDQISCVLNTEVNSGNFIINREANTLHLVDWEKPLYGDPSQDLSHFCAPTTTLWKTDYRMPETDRKQFLDAYRHAVADPHLRDTIVERVLLRDPFNCLRGVSWSAMAWVQYQTGAHLLCNTDTFQKMGSYLEMPFLRSLFDPYLNPARHNKRI